MRFFFSSRRRHTRLQGDWSSDVCSSDLELENLVLWEPVVAGRTYLGESRARHAAFLASERQAAYSGPPGIMGVSLPPKPVAELEATALSSIRRSPAPHVLLLGDEPAGTRPA